MIEVFNVSKSFKIDEKRKLDVLKNISFVLPDNGMYFILGKSGSGKSTLLNLLEGLEDLDSGYININKKRISRRSLEEKENIFKEDIGIMFQHYNLISSITVKENIDLVKSIKGCKNEEKLEYYLHKFKLEKLINKKVDLLSGGEKQRVAIVRALINNPPIIFADEPTGAIDEENSSIIMDELKLISKDKLVLIVTHDQSIVNKYADGKITLNDDKTFTLDNVYSSIEEYKKDNKNKLNTKKTNNKFVFLSKIFKRNIFKNITRNILSTLALAFAFTFIFTTFSIKTSLNDFNKNLIYQFEGYNIFSVSEVKNSSINGSLLSISKKEKPQDYALIDFMKENEINYEIYDNLNYFLSNNIVNFNDNEYKNIVFSPLFNLESNEVIVNRKFVEEYFCSNFTDIIGKELKMTSNNKYEAFSNYYEGEIEENLKLDLTFKIREVKDEFYYLQTPRVYYSYNYLFQILNLTLAPNFTEFEGARISYYDLLERSESNDQINSYSSLIVIDKVYFHNFIDILDSKKYEDFSLSITNEAYTMSTSFIDLTNVLFIGIDVFIILIIFSSIFIIVFLTIYSYLVNKKERAILLLLGSNDKSIDFIYILENILNMFFGFIFSLLILSTVTGFINNIISSSLLINLTINIDIFNNLIIFLIGMLLIICTTLIPLRISKKSIKLANELKEE